MSFTDRMPGGLSGLARLRRYRNGRLSSWDRSGANADYRVVAPGQTQGLGAIEGPGCVRHIWVTTAPLGDFFGIPFGLERNFVSLPLQRSPQPRGAATTWAAISVSMYSSASRTTGTARATI